MATVFVYPEKTREPLGAERWQVSWEQVSADRRNKMIVMNAKRKHLREQHTEEFDKCMDKACEGARYVEIDPDEDLDYMYKNFRGENAHQEALDFAKKVLESGKTAYGAVSVIKQIVDWYVEENRIAEWVSVGETEEVS